MTEQLLFVIIDGAADRPHKLLNNGTPLSAGNTPNLKKIASKAHCGRLEIAGDIAPESDVGVMSLFGFNPFEKHVGRGALEALGIGPLKGNWLALRCNFATLNDKGDLIDRRVGRNLRDDEAKALAKDIKEKVKLDKYYFDFVSTVGHRAVLVIYGRKPTDRFSKKIQNTDPGYQVTASGVANALSKFKPEISKSTPLDSSTEAKISADVLNEFTRKAIEVLKNSQANKTRIARGDLPGNCVVARDAEVNLPTPHKTYPAIKVLADMPLELGISKYLNMQVVPCKTANYPEAASKALDLLSKGNSVYVHFKNLDLFGHDGMPVEKMQELEKIDAGFFSQISLKVDITKVRIVVTSDHATPCEVQGHSSDLVPFLDTGRKPNSKPYNEFNDEKPIHAWELL